MHPTRRPPASNCGRRSCHPAAPPSGCCRFGGCSPGSQTLKNADVGAGASCDSVGVSLPALVLLKIFRSGTNQAAQPESELRVFVEILQKRKRKRNQVDTKSQQDPTKKGEADRTCQKGSPKEKRGRARARKCGNLGVVLEIRRGKLSDEGVKPPKKKSGSSVTGITCHHQRILFSSSPLSPPRMVAPVRGGCCCVQKERRCAQWMSPEALATPLPLRGEKTLTESSQRTLSFCLPFSLYWQHGLLLPRGERARARGVGMGGVRRGTSDAPKQRSEWSRGALQCAPGWSTGLLCLHAQGSERSLAVSFSQKRG